MFADQDQRSAGERQHLRTEQAEFAFADNRNAIRTIDLDALEHSAGGSEWFGKHSMLVRHVFRNGKKVFGWKFEKLGVRAIAAKDAEDRA
jgi:hypothetical protein